MPAPEKRWRYHLTNMKRILCVLMSVVMLGQPIITTAHAAEVTTSQEAETTILNEVETVEISPATETLQTTPIETEQLEPAVETEPSSDETEQSCKSEDIDEDTTDLETEETSADETSAEETSERYFPDYTLEEYGDTMYASGTILSNGCGITCLAALATYLTGHTYYPYELAGYFGSYGNNNVERLLYGSDMLRLPYYQAENYHVVLDALRNGKIVIQLMNRKSLFTQTQHFIVIKGYNANGLLEVYDPSGVNRENWRLKGGFENGFSEDELCWGFDGAWVYDPEKIPEEPYIYKAPEREYVEPRYDGVQLTEDEINLLARLVWVEARGECADGQQAVAEVVLNRLVSGRFQNSLRGIILDEEQFVPQKLLKDAKPGQAQYEAIDRALYGPYVLPMEVFYYGTVRVTDSVWGRIGGHIFCYSNGYNPEKNQE